MTVIWRHNPLHLTLRHICRRVIFCYLGKHLFIPAISKYYLAKIYTFML